MSLQIQENERAFDRGETLRSDRRSAAIKRECDRVQAVYGKRFAELGPDGSKRWRRYSCFDPAHLLLHHSRERVTLRLLDHYGLYPLTNRRVLDIGCGAGLLLQEFLKYGALPSNLHGIDVLGDQIKRARSLNPALNFCRADGAELPFADGSFDVVMQWTVLSSILDPEVRRAVAREMMRVLRPQGLILWYDFWPNNPSNANVLGIKAREIRTLFAGWHCDLRHAVLVPVIARRLAGYSSLICEVLERIPWLCSHYVGGIRRRLDDRAESGIYPAGTSDCEALSRLHSAAFKGFYLTTLGESFLKELYRAFLSDRSAIAIVLHEQGRVVGCAVGSTRPRGFIVRAVLRRGVPMIFALLWNGHGLRSAIRRMLESTRRAHRDETTLFSLAVDLSAQGRGVGRQMVRAFLETAHRRGATRVSLTTDAEGNDAVNRFYQMCGFRLRAVFVTSSGRKMNEFVIDLGDDSKTSSVEHQTSRMMKEAH